MSTPPDTVFETRRELPDDVLQAQAARLVGFDRRFERLRGQMRLLTDVDGVRRWAVRYHHGGMGLVGAIGDRYPLIIFHGDVGTGKTTTAESAADAITRGLDTEGFLLKLSTRVRGIGHVGEMSTLIGDAFVEATNLAGRKRFVTVIIDEGDALAFNRAAERAHHEDRVGVNTLIQKIDDARQLSGRLLIFLCTNRFSSLDPAILRRAALIDEFRRPDEHERSDLFAATLAGVKVTSQLLDELVTLTGPRDGQPGFTFSDIQTRLIPAAVARAYPDRALTANDLLMAGAALKPTPAMHELEA
jgi:AAA+ superfamily predicted ATPase